MKKSVLLVVLLFFFALSVMAQQTGPAQQSAMDNMVRINGGTFSMGSPVTELGRKNDEIQHQVRLSSFFIGKYPVTQKEYQQVMGSNPSSFKDESLPVECVSWYDALVYCNKLSIAEGLSPAYLIYGITDPAAWGVPPSKENGYRYELEWKAVQIVPDSNGYRLPTEAQWEYACRAGTETPFSTGNNIATNQANYNGIFPYNYNPAGENRRRTTPAGSFEPNAWGLYDMHGNVWEWCWDWYDTYTNRYQVEPQGPSNGELRILRGGSWSDVAQFLRSAFRMTNNPASAGSITGFRLVRP